MLQVLLFRTEELRETRNWCRRRRSCGCCYGSKHDPCTFHYRHHNIRRPPIHHRRTLAPNQLSLYIMYVSIAFITYHLVTTTNSPFGSSFIGIIHAFQQPQQRQQRAVNWQEDNSSRHNVEGSMIQNVASSTAPEMQRMRTSLLAANNNNDDDRYQQQQQQFVQTYLRDIDRVLHNHAQIQIARQDHTLLLRYKSNTDNNNNNLGQHNANENSDNDNDTCNDTTTTATNSIQFHSWCNEQRRNKPSLLLYDIDGSEKCIQMIRHIRQSSTSSSATTGSSSSSSSSSSTIATKIENIGSAGGSYLKRRQQQQMIIPEIAYQMIMKVILQRGRLRWKRSNNSNNNYNNYNHHLQQQQQQREHSVSPLSTSSSSTTIICAADQLEELLMEFEEQQQQSESSSSSSSPSSSSSTTTTTTTTTTTSIETYNLVLKAYAICATPRGERLYANRAQTLLRRMEEQILSQQKNILQHHLDDQEECILPVESYLHVLHAFAWQQGNLQSPVDGADVAYHILQKIKKCAPDNVQIHMQATIWVLEAYSKSIDGALQCDALLQDVKLYNTTLTELGYGTIAQQLFDAEVYSNAILAWSKAAAENNIVVDDDLSVLSSSSPTEIFLDDSTLSSQTLSSSTNSATSINVEQAAKNAHNLLLELIHHYMEGSFANGSEPPLIAFNGLISAYSRLGLIHAAEDILWLMERTIRPQCTHLKPNAISYNSILHGISRQSQLQQKLAYKKQNSSRIGGGSISSKTNQALQKALSILAYMEEHCNSRPEIRPNAFSYQSVMKCWLQSSENENHNNGYSREHIVEQAEKLLNRVEELWAKGDTSFDYTNLIYNMLLNSYAKTYNGKRFLSNKAMDLLVRMKQSPYAACQPDIISYTSTIECIAQSLDPMASELADTLLQEVKAKYEETNNIRLRPNLRTYTMTIQTLARNNGNIIRARELLTELVQLYERCCYSTDGNDHDKNIIDNELRPNTYPYNYVLNCAANTIGIDQRLLAFQIATQTYQEMRVSDIVQPDSYSYAFWLKCCNNLLDHGPLRTKAMMYAFEECKRDGLVSNEVLTRLLQGCPKDVVATLLGQGQQPSLDVNDEENSSVIVTASTESKQRLENLHHRKNNNNENLIQQRKLHRNGASSFSTAAATTNVFMNTKKQKNIDNIVSNQNRNTNKNNNNNWTIEDLPSSWSRNIVVQMRPNSMSRR